MQLDSEKPLNFKNIRIFQNNSDNHFKDIILVRIAYRRPRKYDVRYRLVSILLFSAFLIGSAFSNEVVKSEKAINKKFHPGNYILVNLNGSQDPDKKFNAVTQYAGFLGIHKRYRWRDLEPEKNKYDFSDIHRDLKWLKSKNKRLIIHLSDTLTGMRAQMVPDYILKDAEYWGGVVPKKKDSKRFLTKLWVPTIIDRIVKLQMMLGASFDKDPNVELFNIEESALGIHCDKVGEYGYSHKLYLEGLKRRMAGAKAAFPNTNVVQYVNYSGCGGGNIIVPSIMEYAKEIGVGLGGPDIKIHSQRLSNVVYPYLCMNKNIFPIAYSVQRSNYQQRKVSKNSFYSVKEVFKFGSKNLCMDYVSWVQRKPYFINEVVPLVGELSK